MARGDPLHPHDDEADHRHRRELIAQAKGADMEAAREGLLLLWTKYRVRFPEEERRLNYRPGGTD